MSKAATWTDEQPIREEIFSVERLEQLATTLSSAHRVSGRGVRGQRLLLRFEDNGRRLVAAYKTLAESAQDVSPAAEWLVDNFHIVDEQLRQIRVDLPQSYYHELPKVSAGEMQGFPRIYAIAVTIIAHTDSRLDREQLRRFVVAYQQVTPLTIGELWAVAITLRLALVENLRRLTVRVVAAREEREEADRLADDLLESTDDDQRTLVAALIRKLAKRKVISAPFVVQLTRRLRDQDPQVTPLVEWVEAEMQRRGTRIEEVVQLEHHRQAAAQVTVGNIITSMKLLSTVEWPDFVESVNLGEPILASDPAGAYSEMDFETRDRYRHVIERIARRTDADELEVAQRAIDLARQSLPAMGSWHKRQTHVGYFLIDDGLEKLESEFGYHPTVRERVRRVIFRHATGFYLGLICTLTPLILALLVFLAAKGGGTRWELVAVVLMALVPAADLAVSLLNWDITHTFPPRVLPKMNPELPVPVEARTMIVIPTMLTSERVVQDLVERLEVHYLANQDREFFFALLSDFADAPAAEMPEDDSLLEGAIAGIERLNRRYATNGDETFFIFHRRRLWNESEGKWIAWERKRGKLEEFNRLLRGARDTSFEVVQGDRSLLSGVRYVITLDSDTQLPRDAARRLVATIRHPLNRAVFDPNRGRVVCGYGILQPRIGVTLESSGRSTFARLLGGSAGIDPYGTAASDVYQDLFGEGSFTGKGLYDVDAFQSALGSRVPDNSLLSHDLFEGLYARSALVTDIELFDDHPARYDTWAKRLHRWTRGDWQIARWLFPRVPVADGIPVRNVLPLISRWKILDNLRRSVVPTCLVFWLIGAWTFLPGSPLSSTVFALLVASFPIYAPATTHLFSRPKDVPWPGYFARIWADFALNVQRVGMTVAFLPHQALLACDAIVRVAYRKFISGRHMLEWTTAAQVEGGGDLAQSAFLRSMYPVAGLGLASAILVASVRPGAMAYALPFLLSWAASPVLAYMVSRPSRARKRTELTSAERLKMRLIARSTWRFFETFVGDEDHWLPPDNFQEVPAPLIAHRTSPTNIGLLLLSTISAREFGYLGLLEAVERLELTLGTLTRMERHEGHFFNWYDTRTLLPLMPRYVSTVDSGNLAGHLVAVKQAALELSQGSVVGTRTLNGLSDTLAHLRQEVLRIAVIKARSQVVTVRQLSNEIARATELVAAMSGASIDASAWTSLLSELAERAGVAGDIAHVLDSEHGPAGPDTFAECHRWIGLLTNQVRALRCDVDLLMPFAALSNTALTGLLEDRAAEIAPRWRSILNKFSVVPTVVEIESVCEGSLDEIHVIAAELAATKRAEYRPILDELETTGALIERAGFAALSLRERARMIARSCDELIQGMNFRFLFDEDRKLFVIGFNVSEGRFDQSFYDLLASEARLTSLMAIAKGDVPQEHWFRLGRQLTQVDGSGRALVSWAGTMFEYLMPLLVTEDYPATLLHQTYRAVVSRQVAYGREHGVPWGVSESAFHARDLQLNYQYGPFGVPGLGIKRGLSEDLVVAPYATCLAAMIDPHAAIENMRRLEQNGALSRYGFYEAIDFTPDRLPQSSAQIVIHSFMTHHQGMSLVALDNVLHGEVMRRRFHSDPMIQATELLLQERVPQNIAATSFRDEEVVQGRLVNTLTEPVAVAYDSASLPTPRTQLISNGRYAVMVTSAGSGSSVCVLSGGESMAVTRWREDVTRDNWGSFCYLRDVKSGAIWSSGYQPTARRPQSYEVSFTEERAVFKRLDWGILTQTDIVVSPEDDAEVRCVSMTNRSTWVREIEVTSYSEVVLATPAADTAHRAFSSLFVETEYIAAESSLIARRRPRSAEDPLVFAVHTIATEGEVIGAVQYETSRQRFVGRGHDTRLPLALTEDRPLSNTVGAVLDPVFSLRQRVRLKPNETARITFSTAVAASRDQALVLADKYHDVNIFARVERLAWTHAHVQMRHLNIEPREAHLFQRLAGRVLFCDSSLRARSDVLVRNQKTQRELWKYGIGGDIPIVLMRIKIGDDIELLRQMLRAHEYLRLKGLQIDLVILNEDATSYLQLVQDEIHLLIRAAGFQGLQDKPGGVHVRRADIMTEDDKILLHTVARVVLSTERGTLEEQLARRPLEEREQPPLFVARVPERLYPEQSAEGGAGLQHFNGLGGFARKGREYVTILNEGQWTPAPWTNVVANNFDFGFLVTETGSGYTWSVNSRENRLTPWSNDAVGDPGGEALYLRDEETGAIWTPTPLPIRESQPYVIRHGHGYTTFEHTSHGLGQELTLFVPMDATVKISRLRLSNRTDRRRRISVTAFHELLLGVVREQSAPFVVTELDEERQVIFARNSYNNEFANRLGFAAMHPTPTSITCDRKWFLGRNGTPAQPAGLGRSKLDNRSGAGLDPCAALQTVVEIPPGEFRDVIVLLGDCQSKAEAHSLIGRFLDSSAIEDAMSDVLRYWGQTLSSVEVRTPDRAMDLMLNGWLLYQTLVCRVWARSAFYQSGGAYGFRDQLQDVMALVYSHPEIARAQILRAAARQFLEGDVQHWWHPPSGRGVRTRISDDLLWLPYVVCFYCTVTGDLTILDEEESFIEGPLLEEFQHESYQTPEVSSERASIYEHCVRAIERSLATGEHGLPLMGSGDWNDGMNRVGHLGRGESVWLGWFLCATLDAFAPLCSDRGHVETSSRYLAHTGKLRSAIEENGWDGDWYLRAYFDDGTKLGSAENDECRIDSIAQSWAVISGVGDPRRASHAMAAVEEHLVRAGDGLVLLFTPPFDHGARDPGYVKGYLPGVRENGGQYTHAAIWTMMAFAELGNGDRAAELFELLNPVNHSSSRAGLYKYKVEPYVAAADVYAASEHSGRGGWTWYTGSAGWMYRAGLESILGFKLSGDRLRVDPCIPRGWREFEITYRMNHPSDDPQEDTTTIYSIRVENPSGVSRGVSRIEVDTEPVSEIVLVRDGRAHQIRVILGADGNIATEHDRKMARLAN